MRVDLLPAEAWEDLNESLRRLCFSEGKANLQAYPSPTHALFEICEGASNFFSHKRSLGFVKGMTPVVTSLLPGFYKDGYQVQGIVASELKDPATWVDSLKKDTNFVIFASDHPVTGECMEWDTLDAKLNEKKIFSIRISHSDWRQGIPVPRPYSAWILNVAPGLSVAVCGEKVKAPPITATSLSWDAEKMLKLFQETQASFKEEASVIERFEKNPPPGWVALPIGGPRLHDRALIYNLEESGERLLHGLAAKSSGAIQAETTNLCRWRGFSNYFDWWEPSPSLDILRGLLILDVHAINHPKFLEWFAEAEKRN